MTTNRLPIYGVQLVRERSLMSEVKVIRSADDASDVMTQYLDGADREHFVVILLDTKHRVRGIHTVSIGSLDASIVHPREVLKPAILGNSSGIIVAHNHPSGDPTPSPEDIAVTRRLAEACKIMGINLLDHIIVGDGRYSSLQALGYM
ncbi:RadC family protein [Alicyclobacillus sp. SP_1]|uniref:JAB domain-containing protein n=1 Tax=Alicyclobacillus sp. SP_1 TaxID=2942475 RepID=UPI0021573660|nr:DNA repair protein RadC [Alicyclobacillus sp. SP_1]